MADTIKEIYAGTLTVSDIATNGSATLVSTDANTQYAIKDVSVSGVFVPGNTPTLQVNGFNVADLQTSATGTEIVDVNSTLKYKAFDAAPSITNTNLKYIHGTTGAFKFEDSSVYSLNGTAVNSTATTTSITTDPYSYASTLNYALASNGSLFYVYWDGNSQTMLRKRTGGINGSETQIFNLTYGWIVFDKVETYYYADYNNSGTLYKYNINTGVTTNISATGTLAGSSYPSASLMNDGNIILNRSGDGQTDSLTLLNPVTGATSVATGFPNSPVSGQEYKISGYYNSTTNRYTFYKRYTTSLYKCTCNGALTIGSAYSAGFTHQTFSIGALGSSSNINCNYVQVDSTNYSVAIHRVNGKTDLQTYNTATSTTTTASWLPYRTDMDTIIQNSTANTAASNVTATVKVRVTGVKSTI